MCTWAEAAIPAVLAYLSIAVVIGVRFRSAVPTAVSIIASAIVAAVVTRVALAALRNIIIVSYETELVDVRPEVSDTMACQAQLRTGE